MLEILSAGFLIVVCIGLGVLAEEKDWGGGVGFVAGLFWGVVIAIVVLIYYWG